MRLVLGFMLGTVGVLGTIVGPARGRPGAATDGRNGYPPVRSSRPAFPERGRSPSTDGLGKRTDDLVGVETAAALSGWREPCRDGRGAGVEPRIRQLVADLLGIDAEELTSAVSLMDDLAADSLDLAELVVALESAFDIDVSQRRIDGVRTYGDLVEAVFTCLEGRERRARLIPRALPVRSRFTRTAWENATSLERVEELSPYGLQLIEDDAAHAGSGARMEVTLPASAASDDVAAVRGELARVSRRGIEVSVRRDAAWEPDPIAEARPGPPAGETG